MAAAHKGVRVNHRFVRETLTHIGLAASVHASLGVLVEREGAALGATARNELRVSQSVVAETLTHHWLAASVHASLGALVEREGGVMEGRRILLYSYGSGLAGTLFSLYARRVQGPFTLARLAASVRPMLCLRESLPGPLLPGRRCTHLSSVNFLLMLCWAHMLTAHHPGVLLRSLRMCSWTSKRGWTLGAVPRRLSLWRPWHCRRALTGCVTLLGCWRTVLLITCSEGTVQVGS